MSEDLLILAVVVIADAMTLIDNQQENSLRNSSRLRATDCTLPNTTFPWLSLRFSPAAKMSASRPSAQYLAWFCATSSLTCASTSASAGQARQFGNHQAFAGSGREYDGGGLPMLAKPGEGGINGFLLIGA